ncbi:Retrovirus-related Pol polyprotein from transposon 17.6 [Thelohanellus kitauei]|uniref:Retrovirus-related Pol polyprotein from transposon 17.6 n=1 Tax=Thelohanellus kitauei TaxID=669202 RepID=A0A0C2M1Y9_THEKT|nr:Retrovirus-related Pol polyprotein from transposon 17.6 [Thelohanellus kitauei]
MRLAISTHRGTYQQTRLNVGIKSSPGYFQNIMSKLTSDLKRVSVYLDDILVTGSSDESHIHNLECLPKRLEENGLQYNLTRLVYLDQTIPIDGISKGPNIDPIL